MYGTKCKVGILIKDTEFSMYTQILLTPLFELLKGSRAKKLQHLYKVVFDLKQGKYLSRKHSKKEVKYLNLAILLYRLRNPLVILWLYFSRHPLKTKPTHKTSPLKNETNP